MRCINNLDQTSIGFKICRPDRHYVAAVSYAGELAYITTESFNEMLARGHAISEPFIFCKTKNTMFGEISGVLGGAMIFRCDVKIEDDLVWLVPEKEESQDLLVITSDFWRRRNTTAKFVGAAQCLSTTIERGFGRHYHLIHLKQDSGIETATEVTVPDPAKSAFLRAFSKSETKTKVVKDKPLFLHADSTLSI